MAASAGSAREASSASAFAPTMPSTGIPSLASSTAITITKKDEHHHEGEEAEEGHAEDEHEELRIDLAMLQ